MKTVFVNGCFDVIHRGHIELFNYAKSFGDYLVVAIDTDERVKKLKGFFRPFNNQNDRKFVLEAIRYIDRVYFFNSEEELGELILNINPEVMVVGSDWKNKRVVGSQYAKSLKFFDRIGDYSTTKILQGSSHR
jgi:D-beta-D-heptose 7-phosphate kinase/D-beta-D-heptose 1-phosphate adenosyltransferase